MSDLFQSYTDENLTFKPLRKEVGGRVIYGSLRTREGSKIANIRITEQEFQNTFQEWKSKVTINPVPQT